VRKFKLTIQINGVDWDVLFVHAPSPSGARDFLFTSVIEGLWYEKQNWSIVVEEVGSRAAAA
jgi:hypothetical protein